MAKLQDVLRRIISEMDDEEAKDDLKELRDQLAAGKKITAQDIRDAISEAPAEERAALRELLADELTPTPDDDTGGDGGKPKPKPKTKPKPKPDPARRTRPGRRSGQAYDWYVDEETGEVTRSPVAVIYSGDDEPDEVEMFPAADGDDDGSDDTGSDGGTGGDGE